MMHWVCIVYGSGVGVDGEFNFIWDLLIDAVWVTRRFFYGKMIAVLK
ncbi:hypothetical protein [Lacticaseibacillus manihotivorans]|nr:hypothetical protein [Lacticaseibacillus manihotivorans]